jgi:putative ABC transport system substrate-binding protein
VTIEYRWSDTQNDRLPAFAADLVRRQVAVIAAVGGTIGVVPPAPESEIVFSRSSGDVTGVYFFLELGGKRIELLSEMLPRATTIAVLTTPVPGDNREVISVQEAARVLGLQIKFLIANTDRELDAALASLAQMRPDAFMVATSPLSFTRADKIVAAVEQLAIPAMYFRREFAMAGGLASYGTNTDENFRVMGEYTGRILKGEKTGELPVQQPTKIELVLNMKTAKALGLTFPLNLLVRADEVIE